MLLAVALTSCEMSPINVTSPRSRLGEMRAAIVQTGRSTDGVLELDYRGRVTFPMEPRDSSYNLGTKGIFKRRIVLRDTLSGRGDSISLYYAFPSGIAVRIDTLMTFVMHFKQTATGFALILKTKNDSLVCLAGNLFPSELETFQSRTGVQNFHVSSGNDAYLTRNTECGREGDYNMVFTAKSGFVAVPPAKDAELIDGALTYSVYNVINTQIVKTVKTCPTYAGEFAFIAVRR